MEMSFRAKHIISNFKAFYKSLGDFLFWRQIMATLTRYSSFLRIQRLRVQSVLRDAGFPLRASCRKAIDGKDTVPSRSVMLPVVANGFMGLHPNNRDSCHNPQNNCDPCHNPQNNRDFDSPTASRDKSLLFQLLEERSLLAALVEVIERIAS